MRSALLALLLVAPAMNARAQDAAPTEDDPSADDGATADEVEPPEVDPAEAEARLRAEAGALALRRGDLDSALADFERAWALAPTPDRGWALADAQSALGQTEALRETYRGLLALAPEHARAAEARARLSVLEASAPPEPPQTEPEAAPPQAAEPDPPSDEEDESWSILDEPWFWIVAAVVAVGGVAAALILTADPGTEDPIPGDDGFVVRTLVEWE